MNHTSEPETTPTRNAARRKFLTLATTAVGGAGVVGAAVPFIQYWQPSAKARAGAAPIRIDIARLAPGALLTDSWAGKPVWVLRRDPEMIATLEAPELIGALSDADSTVETQQPPYAVNPLRSIRPDILVLVALCTHLGCVPAFAPDPDEAPLGGDWFGGFFCPCHGSTFDLAGRVYQGVPAPTNLVVPPHRYLDEHTLEVGRDEGFAAA
jgi:ubiquinol-cytochrome c reductase iron-sulfur subunit